jgi:ABC-type glycerol-3-phosphate transport system permease component
VDALGHRSRSRRLLLPADWRYAIYGIFTRQETGGAFTGRGYYGAWVEQEFWRPVINTGIVVFFAVIISLTLGTLGGYALARSGHRYAFWILMAALVFRAMPHITLVSGYLLPFFQWNLWGRLSTTIIVLVAINQPFTLWMLHSFFLKIPKDLDESAMIDGCTRFQAFRHVIIPVMWPGVITTGLFSFLLAYNDFAVTAMLLSQENQTIVPGDRQLPGHRRLRGGQRHVRRRRRGVGHRAAVRAGPVLPAPDRQRADGGGGEGLNHATERGG